ncbi:MAG: FecR domain-containing protein [Pseudomonadota bacterium]
MNTRITTVDALSDDLLDEATEWFFRCSIDDCDAEDKRQLEQWLQGDEAHQAAYELVDLNWQKLAQLPRSQCSADWFDPQNKTSSSHSATSEPGPTQWWLRPWFWGGATAASVVLAAVLTMGKVSDSTTFTGYTTTFAETAEVTLDDGTVITLGAETELEVSYTDVSRAVTLTRGEAFFDVVANPERPFRVSSADLSITVVGTAFEVSRADSSLDVAVAEGVVSIAGGGKSRGKNGLNLSEGQRVKAVKGVLSSVETISVDSIGAWRGGVLEYVSAPLSEIISDADRYYSGDLKLMDTSLAEVSISLILDAGDIDGLLNALEAALPIRVSRLDDGTILITRPD